MLRQLALHVEPLTRRHLIADAVDQHHARPLTHPPHLLCPDGELQARGSLPIELSVRLARRQDHERGCDQQQPPRRTVRPAVTPRPGTRASPHLDVLPGSRPRPRCRAQRLQAPRLMAGMPPRMRTPANVVPRLLIFMTSPWATVVCCRVELRTRPAGTAGFGGGHGRQPAIRSMRRNSVIRSNLGGRATPSARA